jgi:hypothetical protein
MACKSMPAKARSKRRRIYCECPSVEPEVCSRRNHRRFGKAFHVCPTNRRREEPVTVVGIPNSPLHIIGNVVPLPALPQGRQDAVVSQFRIIAGMEGEVDLEPFRDFPVTLRFRLLDTAKGSDPRLHRVLEAKSRSLIRQFRHQSQRDSATHRPFTRRRLPPTNATSNPRVYFESFHDASRLSAFQTTVLHNRVPTMLLWKSRHPSTDQRNLEVMLRSTSRSPRQIRRVDQLHCK